MKRAAVIGLGAISQTHIDALQALEQVQLCAVCDLDDTRAQRAPGIPFYTDYHELLQQQKPDCVHICLPHWLHYPVGKECVEAGCHIFCEKPLAVDVRQAEQFALLEQQYPQLHMGLCLQNRWNPSFRKLQQLLESGEYGKITGLRAVVPWARPWEYYAQSPWRGSRELAGSGVLMNQAIHTLDLMFLLGGPVKTVRANVGQLLDYGIEVEDTVSARLEFSDGVCGMFLATNANMQDQSIELWAITENACFLLHGGVLKRMQPDGQFEVLQRDDLPTGGKFYYGSSHTLLITRFYQVLEGGTHEYTHLADGVYSIRLIYAMLQSASQKKVIRLLES